MNMRDLIKIVEGDVPTPDEEQIAAIGQLIADRTEDENSPSKLSTKAFIDLVRQMGIPLTNELLMDLAEQGKLESVIKDVNMDEVVFKGQGEIDGETMNVDKAKDIVSKMAKRSAKKGIK